MIRSTAAICDGDRAGEASNQGVLSSSARADASALSEIADDDPSLFSYVVRGTKHWYLACNSCYAASHVCELCNLSRACLQRQASMFSYTACYHSIEIRYRVHIGTANRHSTCHREYGATRHCRAFIRPMMMRSGSLHCLRKASI